MFRKTFIIVSVGIAALAISGCEKSSAPKTETHSAASEPAGPPLPAGMVLTAAPADARNVVEAKDKAKAGDEVIVQGVIGGRVQPFVEERAIFQLVDTSLPMCNARAE